LKGTVTAVLAAACASQAEQSWSGTALLGDDDEPALSWSVLKTTADQVQVLETQSTPSLNLPEWKNCLLNAVADCCIHQSRRDPRDSASAEQLLYDQLDDVFETTCHEQMIEVVIRTSQWCQNLILQPEQVRLYCQPMADLAAEALRPALEAAKPAPFGRVLLSAAANVLPGLLPMLQDLVGTRLPMVTLSAEVAACGAHQLAVLSHRGELPRDHHDRVVPLPRSEGQVGSHADRGVIPIAGTDR
jgi:hypothetical protein